MNAYKIIEEALNLRTVKIYKAVEGPDGKETRVLDPEATTLMVCLSTILLGIAGISIDEIWDRPLSNAGYSVVEVDINKDKATIIEWNHDEHIPEAQRRKPRFKAK